MYSLVFCNINFLEQITCIDVECAITILLSKLTNRLTVLKADDKVLVHNESQTSTNSDMRTI